MLVIGVLLRVMLLVVEAKGAAVLAMLMSKDMRRHARMLEHYDDEVVGSG